MISKSGTIALVGSGEFLPAMEPVDRALIARLGEAPRVAVVPTASAPDGEPVFARWLSMGVEHFRRLGAEVTPIPLRDRADAEDPGLARRLAAANFVYLSGGKPTYLRETFAGTACWRAIAGVYASGGVLAGCSAGAMVLGGTMFRFRPVPGPADGLGLLPGILVIPHFDEFRLNPGPFLGLLPQTVTVVGVDGTTALVGSYGAWTVVGKGSVTVFAGKDRLRYLGGQAVPIPTS